PTVLPVQVVCRAAVTGPHGKPSTATVVGRKIAGRPPTTAPAGPVAVTVNAPEPVLVHWPWAFGPLMVQTPPSWVVQGVPGWPLLGGGFSVVDTAAGVLVALGRAVAVPVGEGEAVAVGVALAVAVGDRVSEAVAVGVMLRVAVAVGLAVLGSSVSVG